jgi:hypothetical protein
MMTQFGKFTILQEFALVYIALSLYGKFNRADIQVSHINDEYRNRLLAFVHRTPLSREFFERLSSDRHDES